MTTWSFVIPAYNEAPNVGETIAILERSAAAALPRPWEVIVVDDASSDGTGDVARRAGARVVSVERRQIAAVRNAGAREAQGDVIVFVDADTHVSPKTLRAAARAIEGGAIGGGAVVRLEPESPAIDRAITALLAVPYFATGLAAGCFIFARRADLEAVGWFDERYFAGEEVALSMNLRSRGRFVIVSPPVTTSGRKYRLYSPWRIVEQLGRLIVQEIAGPVARERLPLWYDGRRESARE